MMEPMSFASEFLPVELVFTPNWWHRTSGISFERSFYLDTETRIQNDILMRRVLHQRYGQLGLGDPEPQPRPVIGSVHVAGGFIIPAILGAEILFCPDAAPQPEPRCLSVAEIESFEKPDFYHTWPMDELISGMQILSERFGYLTGDLNTDGLLNAAYHFYGQDLFVDFYTAPERVRRFLGIIAEIIVEIAAFIRDRTGTCSISVNRMVERVEPSLFLHANCSVQMISPKSYAEMQLPIERWMADRLQPYGVHHCGDNMHRIAPLYAELPATFFDVGWGSDVAACRKALPEPFFNLRLSPVRMLSCTPHEIAADVESLLLAAGPLDKAGVCCINMDYGVPDDNLFAMYEVIQRFRRFGA
jgi:hypothetical protein